MEKIIERLRKLENDIKVGNFIEGRGISNEIMNYIFEYEAKKEIEMRREINLLINKHNENNKNKIVVFDIYNVVTDMLDEKGFLNKCYDFEESKGFKIISQAINNFLRMEEDNRNNILLEYIKENVTNNNIIFLIGLGKCFPIIRAHKILNNLHQYIDNIPTVLFYPGKYTGTSFKLFNKIEDGNYYRAFKI